MESQESVYNEVELPDKGNEQVFAEGETMFSSQELIDFTQGGFLFTDAAGTITDADDAVSSFLCVSKHSLLGQSLLSFVCPKDQEEYLQRLSNSRDSDLVHLWNTNLCLRTGESISATLSVSESRNREGDLVGFKWLLTRKLTDINVAESALRQAQEDLEKSVKQRTAELAIANEKLKKELIERRRAEQEAGQRARELSALHSATAALLSTLDLEDLLGQILDAATSAIPAGEKGMLHLVARDTGQLEMRAAIGYTDPRIQKFAFPSSKGYVAKAARLRTPLLIHNIQTDPSIRYEGKISEVRAIQSAIVVPLILNDQVIGALSLDSPNQRAFTEDDLWLLVSFAATATAAIRNAQLHMEMQRLAITDSLTNLYNRRGFYELGKREVERARRFGRPLSTIMFDIDLFKDVNDSFGHEIGDQVLRAVADRINRNVREVDVLSRYGGDEFVILLSETGMFTAANTAERLRKCIADAPIVVEGEIAINVTISLGVAKASAGTPDLTSLVHSADLALYAAKQAGRNRVQVG